MITKLEFIIFYSIFLFFTIQISSMAGAYILSGVSSPTAPTKPSGIIDSIGWVVSNIGYFFKMMTVSTEFALFGAVVLTPFLIALIWIVIEVIRGV